MKRLTGSVVMCALVSCLLFWGAAEALAQGKCQASAKQFFGEYNGVEFSTTITVGSEEHYFSAYRLGDEVIEFLVVPSDDPGATSISVSYQHGLMTSRFPPILVLELAGGSQAVPHVVERAFSQMNGTLLTQLRSSVLPGLVGLTTSEEMVSILQVQLALVHYSVDSVGPNPENIWECGAYAACYWGCVFGGGGWLDCGTSCNGGGPGQGRCY
ncbi:MAG: hypothetical protein KJZ57_00650 [Anaerolineales bacterium]|nr:hypothetical protein [Anaerolineales bacterium]